MMKSFGDERVELAARAMYETDRMAGAPPWADAPVADRRQWYAFAELAMAELEANGYRVDAPTPLGVRCPECRGGRFSPTHVDQVCGTCKGRAFLAENAPTQETQK